eukprot:6200001-Pleurochrysis_carterae.AAC.2
MASQQANVIAPAPATAQPNDWSGRQLWDARYMKEQEDIDPDTFDWIVSADSVVHELSDVKDVAYTARILDIGCGNSEFCEVACSAGYRHLVGIDFSAPVIQTMRQRSAALALQDRISYHIADATNMELFQHDCTDIIVDKGCLDAMVTAWDHARLLASRGRCEQSLVNGHEVSARIEVGRFLNECERILHEDGMLLIYSYEEPAARLPFFSRWRVEYKTVENGCYLYVCRALVASLLRVVLHVDDFEAGPSVRISIDLSRPAERLRAQHEGAVA